MNKNDKLIKIEDLSTYPSDLIAFFEENKERLFNTFNNNLVKLDESTFLYKKIKEMIKNNFFYAIHASRLVNTKTVEEKGLVLTSDSKFLMQQLLHNIKNELKKNEFEEIEKIIYLMQKEEKIYWDSKKYNKIWFILGNIEDISMKNGFYMMEKYGGEFLEDVFININKRELYYEKIANMGNPYAIEFKIEFSKICEFLQYKIINRMLEKYLFNTKSKYSFIEGYTKKDIPSNQIVGIVFVNIEEK